jgi:hypothetical protein
MLSFTVPSLDLLAQQHELRQKQQQGQHEDQEKRREVLLSTIATSLVSHFATHATVFEGRVLVVLIFHMSSEQQQCHSLTAWAWLLELLSHGPFACVNLNHTVLPCRTRRCCRQHVFEQHHQQQQSNDRVAQSTIYCYLLNRTHGKDDNNNNNIYLSFNLWHAHVHHHES